MKDWKSECDKLRGELKQIREQLEWERTHRIRREDIEQERREETRKLFKDLFLDVIGR